MASSKVALAKLGMWKNSSTVLKLTLLTKGGKPETLRGRISAIDEELCVVGFAVTKSHSLERLDLDGAFFEVGKCVVEAERFGDRLKFEEIAMQRPKKNRPV